VVCGAKKSVAHHEDYKKPLDVIWLCQEHHKAVHMRGLESFEAEIKLAKADKKYLNQREADNGTC
jgi:ribosomal protein L15E